MRSTPVLLVGTLDTKGRELGCFRDVLRGHRIETMVIDAGPMGPPSLAPCQHFDEPDAAEAPFSALAAGLSSYPQVRLEHRDEHNNDPRSADAAARAMLELSSPRRES